MTIQTVLQSIMKQRGFNLTSLAKELGYRSISGMRDRVRTKNIGIVTALRILDAMNYDIIIKSRLADKAVYILTEQDPENPDIPDISDNASADISDISDNADTADKADNSMNIDIDALLKE